METIQILEDVRYPLLFQSGGGFTISGWKTHHSHKDLLPIWRWEHRATLQYGKRQFLVFVDQKNEKLHIEEIVNEDTETISDESLFDELLNFAQSHGFCSKAIPLPKPITSRFL